MATPKRKSPKRGGKKESMISLFITLYLLITIPCNLSSLILPYTL
jgi:hypothetical protein